MTWFARKPAKAVHRHVGGLETVNLRNQRCHEVHRHVGGLENRESLSVVWFRVHRHVGGLEKSLT